jgi:O-antigen/teichoic acid export membrane protein
MSAPDAAAWGLVGLLCALQALTGFTSGYLRGIQRFDRLAMVTLASLGSLLAGVMIGSITLGVAGAIAGYCVGSAVPAALSLHHAARDPAPSREIVIRVRRYAFFAWAAALSSTFVWSRAEMFFLERSTGSAAVGLFTVAVTLANLASQGPMLLTAGLLPYFARSFGEGATGKVREAYATATRVLAFVVLPACFGTAALLPTLLPLIYGSAFAGAVPAATVLVLSAGVGAISSVGASLIMAMDRSDFVFISGLVAAALVVTAGLTVIPAFGLMGAAWARASIQLVAVGLGSGFMFWRLGFPLPIFDLGRLLLAAALCGLVARSCLLLGSGVGPLVLAVVGGGATYAISVRVLRALHPADTERLKVLCERLPAAIGGACMSIIGLLTPGGAGGGAALVALPQERSAGDGN